jgi:hypothetical protein
VISPQRWGAVFISKHHYAEELAKSGEQVYFVNPPSFGLMSKVRLSFVKHGQYSIGIIDYNIPFIIRRMHNRAPFVYEMYMQTFVVPRINKLCRNIKEAWIFNADFVHDVKKMKAEKHIVFYADMVHWNQWKKQLRKADLFVTVSEYIFKTCGDWCKRKLLINHGLAGEFTEVTDADNTITSETINAGYIGNLMIGDVLDMDAIEALIARFPGVHFHFIGPYEPATNNLGSNFTPRIISFIDTLKNASNVTLHGVAEKNELVKKINSMDVFIIAYSRTRDHNMASNSHKILEYLSTGKTIVSYPISFYKDQPGLIEFAEENIGSFVSLFGKVIGQLDLYNSEENSQRRKNYALQNTYSGNIHKIRKHLYQ